MSYGWKGVVLGKESKRRQFPSDSIWFVHKLQLERCVKSIGVFGNVEEPR